jgi:hypothetical protein
MAPISQFKNANKTGVANGSWTQVYTAPSSKASYIIELDIACVGASGVQASVRVYDSSATLNTYLVKAAPVPVGSSLQVVDTQKIVLESLDRIEVTCDTVGETVDVICSLIEDVNS